jgi:RNA polymerase sigma-70 factor (ECF subfamily)
MVFSVSLRVLYDWQLAEDVTQEVFLRLWQRPESYDPTRGRLLSWLMSVTRNRAIDERRRIGSPAAQRRRTRRRCFSSRDQDATGDPAFGAALAESRRGGAGGDGAAPPPPSARC